MLVQTAVSVQELSLQSPPFLSMAFVFSNTEWQASLPFIPWQGYIFCSFSFHLCQMYKWMPRFWADSDAIGRGIHGLHYMNMHFLLLFSSSCIFFKPRGIILHFESSTLVTNYSSVKKNKNIFEYTKAQGGTLEAFPKHGHQQSENSSQESKKLWK